MQELEELLPLRWLRGRGTGSLCSQGNGTTGLSVSSLSHTEENTCYEIIRQGVGDVWKEGSVFLPRTQVHPHQVAHSHLEPPISGDPTPSGLHEHCAHVVDINSCNHIHLDINKIISLFQGTYRGGSEHLEDRCGNGIFFTIVFAQVTSSPSPPS